ncbi:MAG: type VI secretion system ImpA family N-terminal domain-containing protein [Bradyrhizobium sp.]|nr:type VI secretion system ImpA family N-terminal domain-containing protein [Bradyrhizobium sp.]
MSAIEAAATDVAAVAAADTRAGTAPQPGAIDHAIAALCTPLSQADPCGPDLDLAGDRDYLNFFAQTEGELPNSFFSSEDGRPFDRASVDLPGHVTAIVPLWERSRDLRLLIMRARLLILNRDLGGFAVSVAAIARWLDGFWDVVHPRPDDGGAARIAALESLDLPTVFFPLQYAPLCEGGRVGIITYRAWMIASGEVKPRSGEPTHPSAAIAEAIAAAPLDVLEATRTHVATIKISLGRIRELFARKGSSVGLENLAVLVAKIQKLVDPRVALEEQAQASAENADEARTAAQAASAAAMAEGAPTSLAEAEQALAAIAAYYSGSEPSSPTLPLVRQAHQLIGKSFFEVMSVLVPNQMEKAAFQIGSDQFFELPVGKLSKLPEAQPADDGADHAAAPAPSAGGARSCRVESRAQALLLLDQVQRFFRHSEPSSPIPMLCDRARALAERDFMSVLREVLPKSALKTVGADR